MLPRLASRAVADDTVSELDQFGIALKHFGYEPFPCWAPCIGGVVNVDHTREQVCRVVRKQLPGSKIDCAIADVQQVSGTVKGISRDRDARFRLCQFHHRPNASARLRLERKSDPPLAAVMVIDGLSFSQQPVAYALRLADDRSVGIALPVSAVKREPRSAGMVEPCLTAQRINQSAGVAYVGFGMTGLRSVSRNAARDSLHL